MKSCNFRSKKDSIVNWFQTNGLLDKEFNILDSNRFKEANKQWSDYAQYNFDTTQSLFDIRDGKGIPNEEVFQILDGKYTPTDIPQVLINGKPSILYQSILEETGNHFTAKKIYEQTKTKEFKEWFKNSPIVDENGEPLLVYHGSPYQFNEFRPRWFPEDSEMHSGYFFAESKNHFIVSKSPYIVPAFLSAQDMYTLEPWNSKEQIGEELDHDTSFKYLREGHDAVKGIEFNSTGIDNLIAYSVKSKNQIKSLFNVGEYSTNPNIYLQLESLSQNQISASLYDQLATFLKSVNPEFRIETISDLSVNGVANLSEFLIQLKKGKESALFEETAHVYFESLTDKKLKEELLDQITYTKIYQKVVSDYSGLREYRNEDGSVNYPKLKHEAVAKLVSLYMQDKQAFNYWTGSSRLIFSFKQLIDRFVRWIKNLPNPFSYSANQILQGNVSSLNSELLRNAGIFYSIRDYQNFSTLKEDLSKYDRIYFNLNDTLLNLKSWRFQNKAGMFFDTTLRDELNRYYTKSELTKLGQELQDKIDVIGADKITIFTDAPLTDELEARIRGLYGNVKLVSTGTETIETTIDEEGNPIDKIVTSSNKTEFLSNESDQYPNGKLFVVDNHRTDIYKGLKDNMTPHFYSNKGVKYISPQQQERIEFQNQKVREFTQGVTEEVNSLTKSNLIPLVKQSLSIVRNIIRKLENEKNVELSETFKDEYGNLTLPVDKARFINSLLEDTEQFEKAILHFVYTIESVRSFFISANKLDFKGLNGRGLRDLSESNDPEDVETGIREAAVLMRNILSWEEWINAIYPHLQDTHLISKVINDFRGELDKSKAKVNEMAVSLLSKNLEKEWSNYNKGVESKIKANLIGVEEGDRQKVTAQKLADWLYGKQGDINVLSFFENPLFIGDKVMSALSKKLELLTQVADETTLNQTVKLSQKLWEIGERLRMSDIEIGKKITYVDQETYWDNGELKTRDKKRFINPFKDTYKYDLEKQKFLDAREKWIEAKNNNNLTNEFELYVEAKRNWENWIDANWYDELTPEGRKIYENIPNLVDEDFEKALEKQKEIWNRIKELELELKFPTLSSESEESLNRRIEEELRELRLLRNIHTEKGELKTGEDLIIANKLREKSKIDRQIRDYQLDKKEFLDSIREQISSITEESVRQTLLGLLDTNNLTKLYKYAEEFAPQVFVDWLDKNTRTKYSDDFYQKRKELFDKLNEILPTNEIKDELKKVWKEITDMTSYLRDQDMVLDASDTNPIVQEKIKQYELYIEDLKDLLREGNVPQEAREIINQLSQIQSKDSTDYYKEVMFEKLNPFRLVGLTANTDFISMINSAAFREWIRKGDKTQEEEKFETWFWNNHINKKVEGEYYTTPTYIWMKIEPSDKSDILLIPSWKYYTRDLKESINLELDDKKVFIQIKTPKNEKTWDDISSRWLPKSQQFMNEKWDEIQKSPLFEYLNTLRTFLKEIQKDTFHNSQIGDDVPTLHKRYTEGQFLKTAWKTFTNKVNPQEHGEANLDSKGKGFKQIIQGILGINEKEEDKEVRTDYLGKKIQRFFTPFTAYKSPEEVTDDTLLAVIQYAHGLERVKQLSQSLPKINLLEQIFTQFAPQAQGVKNQNGQPIPAGTNNRLKLLQHIEKFKLYGDFKEFELGRQVDTSLLALRRVTSIGSQSVLNLPNALKNWLQGTLMNLVLSGAYNWNSKRSVLKAIKSPKTSFAYFLSQMVTKEKGLDFHIQAFFNPLLEREINEVFKRGALGITGQEHNVMLTAKYSEFGPGNILLYSHLFHQKTDHGKTLYESLKLEGDRLVVEGTINGEPIDLQEIKLKYKTLLEEVLGKQWNQTVAQRYTLWSAVEFFKKFFIPGMRKRFGGKRTNPVLGETEGYYTTTLRLGLAYFYKRFYDAKYDSTLTPEEKIRLRQARDEFGLMLASYLVIVFGFGFDPDDKDKYKKLKKNSWLENMALLVALNTKRETDSLNPFPLLTMQESLLPPVLNETFSYVKEPFIGFSTITDGKKLFDATFSLLADSDQAYYDKDMPTYFIEKGDSKAAHYAWKLTNLDEFLYQQEPEKKIQIITNFAKSK